MQVGKGAQEALVLNSIYSLRNRPITNATDKRAVFTEPFFVDPSCDHFCLRAGSDAVDMGVALTKTATAGTGTKVPVCASDSFCDGFGIVKPDRVRIGNEQVSTISVNTKCKSITIDRSTSWSKGALVYLSYTGSSPDIGAVGSR